MTNLTFITLAYELSIEGVETSSYCFKTEQASGNGGFMVNVNMLNMVYTKNQDMPYLVYLGLTGFFLQSRPVSFESCQKGSRSEGLAIPVYIAALGIECRWPSKFLFFRLCSDNNCLCKKALPGRPVSFCPKDKIWRCIY